MCCFHHDLALLPVVRERAVWSEFYLASFDFPVSKDMYIARHSLSICFNRRSQIFAVKIFSSVSGTMKIKCAKNLNTYMCYVAEPSSDKIFFAQKFQT